MDKLLLKMPVDKVERMANALETHLNSGQTTENYLEINELVTWLRHRVAAARVRSTHPDAA